jgi:hypothetical protein
MGGRDQSRRECQIPDREKWILDVSNSRLDSYRKMLLSSGKVRRVNSSPRSVDQQAYFADLIAREMSRRKHDK